MKNRRTRKNHEARNNLWTAEDTKSLKVGDTIQMSRHGLYESSDERVIQKKITELELNDDGSIKWFRTSNKKRFMIRYNEFGNISTIRAMSSKSQYQPEGFIKD